MVEGENKLSEVPKNASMNSGVFQLMKLLRTKGFTFYSGGFVVFRRKKRQNYWPIVTAPFHAAHGGSDP